MSAIAPTPSEVANIIEANDRAMQSQIQQWHSLDSDYWSFRGNAKREDMHSCFQYPAMMVPKMQGELIQAVKTAVPTIKNLYEPFIGSGTVLTEGMKLGLNIHGQDINPLAVLICRAKTGPFYDDGLKARADDLKSQIKTDTVTSIDVCFPGLMRWFREDVAIELSRIRRAIRKERFRWCRRFFWVALAETVRLTSNSRTSTYKLYRRPDENINERSMSVIDVFFNILDRNIEGLSEKKGILEEKGLINRGKYVGTVKVAHKDTTNDLLSEANSSLHELLVTSPPYGDNRTTISYGQHSYLPLQWIDLEDIDPNLSQEWLVTSYEIDRRSLGGSLRNSIREAQPLLDISPSFRRIMNDLKDETDDRKQRVASFYRDLYRCIDPVMSNLSDNAYMIWTVGNRRVAGRSIPMDNILADLLLYKGAETVAQIHRAIPSKRMASKAGPYTTIGAETVLIMRKTMLSAHVKQPQ